ncbi:MAG: gas vesicle protein GvpO [candidate division Zixibacteria bacterium]|nr:gas vesicle protein GvpO [candidate division Zixibacteria bacterium]
MEMTVPKLIERAREQLAEVIGLKLSSTLSASKDDRGWLISVEMIEKKSIPDGMDILATYEARVNDKGELLEFSRKKLRKRIDTAEEQE